MRLFDVACFIGRWPGERLAFDSPAGLLKEMDRLGIGQALVSHTAAWQNSPIEGNRLLMEAIMGQPRLEPCWVITPGPLLESSGGVDALLEDMARQHVRAVRLCPRDHVFPLADWMTGGLFQALDERRYLVVMDLDQVFLQVGMYDYDANGLEHVYQLCRKYPHLSLVLSRVGYRAYQNLLPLLESCPNLYLDTSYFATHQGLEEVVRRFGAERVLFATAQPLADAGGALARLLFAGIGSDAQERIACENLERLLDRVILRGTREESPQERPADRQTRVQIVEGPTDRLAGLQITDAHGHLGPYHKFYIPEPDEDGLIRVMDRCGVAQLALSSHLAITSDWKLGNQRTARAVACYPNRLIGQVVVSPSEPEAQHAELSHYFDDLGFRAIKVVPDTHLHPIDGDGYRPAWEFASQRGCPLYCHTFHGSRLDDPQMFASLARRYPQVPMILVHSGALTAGLPGAIELAKSYSNLYLDVSGSYITGDWIRRMVEAVGADRVIYSSDIPFIDLRYSLGRVLFSGLDQVALSLVLGGNIRRLLKISTS